jgi:glutathione S-transferase
MLTFYFAPGSSSMAVHIALHEVGVPFESRPISFARRDHRAPDYLALNPEGKVPTLLINGRPLTEVAAILYYLAKVFPAAGLLPEGDAEAEAQAISWMSFIAATLHPARRLGSRTPARYSRSPTGDWGRRHGRWGVTRLPISISSVSIGASPIL